MSPTKEKRFLRTVLSRIDHAPRNAAAMTWKLAVFWVALVLLVTLASVAGRLIPFGAATVVFACLGAAGATAYMLIRSATGWLLLARFVDREAIETRLAELGA